MKLFASILSLSLALLAGGPALLAQEKENLIPNPSFEELERSPHINYIRSGVKSWKTANQGYTDYFHAENRDFGNQTPLNRFGMQKPHSGKAYAGFCLQQGNKARDGGTFAEYLHTSLTAPLEAGKKYCVTAFISRADIGTDYVKTLGIHFSEEEIRVFGYDYLKDRSPQIEFRNEGGWRDSLEWTLLCEEYVATGREKWLTFGCFEPHQNINVHYYVDDLSLYAMADELDCACANPPASPGSTWNFGNILFEFDRDVLLPESNAVISRIAAWLQEHADVRIEVGGHTDGLGAPGYNRPLSARRAARVKEALVSLGIAEDRISIQGYGSSLPVAPNDSEAGRQLNRRVAITLRPSGD